MASQTLADNQACCEVSSFIRGLHFYMNLWTPMPGEVLLLRREPENAYGKYAVAVVKLVGNTTVGHIPYNLAQIFSSSLSRGFNKGTVEVTGEKVNRGAGYGLEVPCIYRLYGPKCYVDRAQDKINNLQHDLLVSAISYSVPAVIMNSMVYLHCQHYIAQNNITSHV